jgi:hypothetical protein
MYMDTPRGYAILGFVGEFAETNLLESQQNVQNLYINTQTASVLGKPTSPPLPRGHTLGPRAH